MSLTKNKRSKTKKKKNMQKNKKKYKQTKTEKTLSINVMTYKNYLKIKICTNTKYFDKMHANVVRTMPLTIDTSSRILLIVHMDGLTILSRRFVYVLG